MRDVIGRVLEATHDLRIEDGFTPKEVVNYITANYRVDRQQASRQVYAALRRGASNGVFRLRKGRYAVGAISSFSNVSEYEEPKLTLSSDESECEGQKSSFTSDVSEYGEPQDCGILTEPKTKKSCRRKKARRRGCTKIWRPRSTRKRCSRSKKGRSRSRKRGRSKRRGKSSRRKALCKRARSKSRRRRKARKSLCKRRKVHRRKSLSRRRGKSACKRGKARRKARKARKVKGCAGKRAAKKHKPKQKRKNLCKPKKGAVGGEGSAAIVQGQSGECSSAPEVKTELTENQPDYCT